MLAIAVTGEEYGTATGFLGLEPSRLGKLGNFTALLRQHGVLEPVTAAICQLARTPATSTSTASPSSTTPAADGKAASARPRSIPEAGAARATSCWRSTAAPPRPAPRRTSSSPGSA